MKVKRVVNEEGKKRLERALQQLGHAEGRVGYFATAKYPDGTSVAYVAAIQELGDPSHNIPPRPTMRPAGKETQKMARSQLKEMLRAVLSGQDTMVGAMSKICDFCAGTIKKNIKEITSPALKPSTVLARLSMKKQGSFVNLSVAKPLVHTGQLAGAPTYEVIKK